VLRQVGIEAPNDRVRIKVELCKSFHQRS
jgi:hypothetical protein